MSEYRATSFDSEIEEMERTILLLCGGNEPTKLVKVRQDAQVLMTKRDVYLFTHE